MKGKHQRRNLRKETLRPRVSAATLLLLYYETAENIHLQATGIHFISFCFVN